MNRVKPFDAFFLATESRRSPWHMAGCEVFELPKGVKASTFLAKLEQGMREQVAVAPFNQVLDTSGLWPRWVESEVDMDYHLRRQVLPAPGGDGELMTALEHFCAATLDRNLPLWECLIIEGLSKRRFALAFKVHHALVDGQGGLKIILRALSTRANDSATRALWGDNRSSGKRRKSRAKSKTAAPANARFPAVDKLLRHNWLQVARDLRLFRASASALNQRPDSSARRFGVGDLPLDKVRSVAAASGSSVNDVLLCVVDEAVHRYLEQSGRSPGVELVAGMPVSVRAEGAEGGNQAGLLTIELGGPRAKPLRRLEVINANTQRAKSHLRELPAGFLMAYGVAVLGMPLLLQTIPGMAEKRPVINLGVSNVSPPAGTNYLDNSLYLSGAKLVGMYTQPILPPGVLLNVTAASMKGKLCLGIGSTREAIDQPLLLMEYMSEALEQLQQQLSQQS